MVNYHEFEWINFLANLNEDDKFLAIHKDKIRPATKGVGLNFSLCRFVSSLVDQCIYCLSYMCTRDNTLFNPLQFQGPKQDTDHKPKKSYPWKAKG